MPREYLPSRGPNEGDYMVVCSACNGDGEVDNSCSRHPSMNCDCAVRPSTVTCDRCNGDGRVEEIPEDVPEEVPDDL